MNKKKGGRIDEEKETKEWGDNNEENENMTTEDEDGSGKDTKQNRKENEGSF